MREMRSYKMCHQHEENSSTTAEQSTSGWEFQSTVSIWKSYVSTERLVSLVQDHKVLTATVW